MNARTSPAPVCNPDLHGTGQVSDVWIQFFVSVTFKNPNEVSDCNLAWTCVPPQVQLEHFGFILHAARQVLQRRQSFETRHPQPAFLVCERSCHC